MEKAYNVLLDTNFLLSLVRLKVHGFEEIRKKIKPVFFTLCGVMKELEELSKNKTIEKEVNTVKELLKKNDVTVLENEKDVDSELLEKSKEYLIATNDSELRKKIKSFGGKSIYIRNRSIVEINGY